MRHTDACTSADETYRLEMELSSLTMLDVLHGRRAAPGGLRWRHQTGGIPDSHRFYPHVLRTQERDRLADSLRTERDTCPRCGARGDAGCGHARVKGGRLVAL